MAGTVSLCGSTQDDSQHTHLHWHLDPSPASCPLYVSLTGEQLGPEPDGSKVSGATPHPQAQGRMGRVPTDAQPHCIITWNQGTRQHWLRHP